MSDKDVTLVLDGQEFDVKNFKITTEIEEETDSRNGRATVEGSTRLEVETSDE